VEPKILFDSKEFAAGESSPRASRVDDGAGGRRVVPPLTSNRKSRLIR
jgi:hypothetical protein